MNSLYWKYFAVLCLSWFSWYVNSLSLPSSHLQPLPRTNPFHLTSSYASTTKKQNPTNQLIISKPSIYTRSKQYLQKKLRDWEFWSRVIQIYSSYKYHQWNDYLQSNNPQYNATEQLTQIHELNSIRMMDLCLQLRGFYLKAGQFLGTRYDFMPKEYLIKLSKLHDDVPALEPQEIQNILESEFPGELEDYFDEIELDAPVGSASIAQVHRGKWKANQEIVAIKIQNPYAFHLMQEDLSNLYYLAKFLQKTELKFDILSAIEELQKQIPNEFDFQQEANQLTLFGSLLAKKYPSIVIPKPYYATKKVLVMSYIDGHNLSQLSRKHTHKTWLQKQFGQRLLHILAQAWGEQIFVLKQFHADPHPGNICVLKQPIQPPKQFGIFDWGQIKHIPHDLYHHFVSLMDALQSNSPEQIVIHFKKLGIQVKDPFDHESILGLAKTMFDTKTYSALTNNPFDANSSIKRNAILKIPPDLFFLIRTIQLFKGLAHGFEVNHFSIVQEWKPFIQQAIRKH